MREGNHIYLFVFYSPTDSYPPGESCQEISREGREGVDGEGA